MESSPNTLDQAAISELRNMTPGDDSFFSEIVALFLEDTPLRLDDLDRSLAAGDVPTLTRVAHSLKGSSSNFGANRLRGLAEKIETLGKHAQLSLVPTPLNELKLEFVRVKAALESELQKK